MADIYAAELRATAGFRKRVAIKRMRPHLTENDEYVRMFLEEARVWSRLSHPKICEVYELGQLDGEYYIAMEYLHGVSLSKLIGTCVRAGRRLPVPAVVRMLAQACDGLHHAHERRDGEDRPVSVIHRDVSPQNLFVRDDGVVKVIDFGIAKANDADDHTAAGTVKGKERYMSPEQIRNEALDRRTDIWSLGVVLFEALTGKGLFQRPTFLETAQAVINDPLPSIRRLCPEAPPALDDVLSRALCRSHQWRFATALDLRDALIDSVAPGDISSLDDVGALVRAMCGNTLAERELLFELEDVPDAPPAPAGRRASRRTAATAVAKPPPRADSTSTDSSDSTGKLTVLPPAPQPTSSDVVAVAPAETLPSEPVAAGSQSRRYGWLAVAALAAAIAATVGGVALAIAPADGPSGRAAAPTPVAAGAPMVQPPGTIPDAAPAPLIAPLPTPPETDATVSDSAPEPAQPGGADDAGEAAAAPRRGKRRRPRARENTAPRAPVAEPRRDEPAAEPRAVEPPKPGTLFVDSFPYATLYLDGKRLGDTPLLGKKIPPGSHTLRAVTADGRAKTMDIDVRPGKRLRRRIRW